MNDSNLETQFAAKCVELKFLSSAQADQIISAAGDQTGGFRQAAIKLGWLDAESVDIADSLLHPTELAPGYEILELIGRGGMGVVYRARQTDLDRIVAIKVILVGNLSNSNTAKRFEREARMVARLHHPNIVQAWNFGNHRGRYFLAMEYVAGRTCDQLIRGNHPLSSWLAWQFVRQTASGLSHANHHQVIHRDIKPANLMVVPPPEGVSLPPGVDMIKIADFGLAILDDMTEERARVTTGDALVGSPAYMSPEQFGGDDVDFRSDIYSLGATALTLLTGKTPFPSKSLAHLVSLKMRGIGTEDESLRGLPSLQRELLLKMLAVDPKDRPQSYPELISDIDRVLSDDPMIAAVGVVSSKETRGDVGDRANFDRHSAVTQVVNDSAVQTPLPRRSRIKVYALIASWIMFAILMTFYATSAPNRGPRSYIDIGKSQALFDGVGLTGWDVDGTMVGAWTVLEGPDGANCITSLVDDGAITRRLPAWDHQRVSLLVHVSHPNSRADIDFGFSASNLKSERMTVRVNADSIAVGKKVGDFGKFSVHHSQPAPKNLLERAHVLDLERQAEDWYVFFEEKFVGTLPIGVQTGAPCLRLVVAENQIEDQARVFFSDAQSSELTRKPAVTHEE